jgi:hypothetical protein
MNTSKSQAGKQARNNQTPKTRQQQRNGKRGQQHPHVLHEDRKFQEHEHPELRLTR